jgi:hypothetical protein
MDRQSLVLALLLIIQVMTDPPWTHIACGAILGLAISWILRRLEPHYRMQILREYDLADIHRDNPQRRDHHLQMAQWYATGCATPKPQEPQEPYDSNEKP